MLEDTYVRTSFTPIRMISGNNDPVALHIELQNKSRKTRSYSVNVKVPSILGFDLSGLMREKRVRIKDIHPDAAKEALFSIYGRYNLVPGHYDIEVTVREHEDRFDKVVSQTVQTASLRVE